MSKSRLVLTLLAIGSAIFFWRRRRRSRERVDLYYADGSMISFEPEEEDAAGLFPLARDVVRAATPSET